MQYMNRLTLVAATLASLALVTACRDAGTANSPSGVIASANSNASAELSWQAPTQNTDGSTLTNISGYHIHVGTDPNALGTIIDVTDASATAYIVNNLLPGTWYFGVSAYSTAGVEGDLSNIGSKTVG